jgi:hypothetical protein
MDVHCLKCKHYMSTYDPQAPRGCRYFKIQSREFPSQVVKRESGQDCMAFEERKHLEPLKEDPKGWTRG